MLNIDLFEVYTSNEVKIYITIITKRTRH